MQINPNIFKAYDIRGIYGEDFDEKLAYDLGIAFANMRKKELGINEITIAVGSDMRISSPILKEGLIKGLIDAGANVVDIGLASTPTFYFAVANYKYDGGIIVSASHNPKEYNGFKLVREKALPISKESGIMDLKEIILNNDLVKSSEKGELTENKNVLEDQINHDILYTDLSKIKSFKIVIDPANSMGSLYFDELFKNLNCTIIKINWELDGNFPNHEADPFKKENIKSLCQKVKEENADLGIATDGDGDRIFFVDNVGEPIEPGIMRAILSKIFLKEFPGAKIAYDIRPGKITEDIINENGGRPIITRVGHSLIKEQAIKEGAVFAGESSGHFFLNMPEGFYEAPIVMALKILQELSDSNMKLSDYIIPFKKYYHSGEINTKVENINKKINELKEKYRDGKINELDGVTIEYNDYWFNVRPSNTEPLLRLCLEAKTKAVMEEKRDEILKIINN